MEKIMLAECCRDYLKLKIYMQFPSANRRNDYRKWQVINKVNSGVKKPKCQIGKRESSVENLFSVIGKK